MPIKLFTSEILFLLILVSGTATAQVKSLCEKYENVVWSCQAKKKFYSICASKDLTETKGYLQYRAGTLDRIELKYPPVLQHPKGQFEYELLAHGAILIFKNGLYIYEISEDLIGQPRIRVSKDEKDIASFRCGDSTQSLTNNSTIEIFRTVGAYQ